MEHLLDLLSPQLRILLTLVTALAIVLFSGVYFLPMLHRLKYGQSIREEGPASHQAKSGTPTMGGVMIVLAVTAATLLFAPLTVTTLLALFIFLGHFLLGFADDYIKVVAVAALFYAVLMYGMDGGLMAFSTAIIGACIGFLWYNHHPARIFMGDTGSLALGGALAGVAILSHTELLLPIVGFVFFCEALSVILQVASFKTRGKRIFRMSPIHHHFELGGWSETRVVYTFWAVGAAGALLAWIVVLLS